MDRQPDGGWVVYNLALARDLHCRAAEEPVHARVWIQRSLHFLFSFCREHRHDDRIISRYRDSVAILQLRWLSALGLHHFTFYTPKIRCSSRSGASKDMSCKFYETTLDSYTTCNF